MASLPIELILSVVAGVVSALFAAYYWRKRRQYKRAEELRKKARIALKEQKKRPAARRRAENKRDWRSILRRDVDRLQKDLEVVREFASPAEYESLKKTVDHLALQLRADDEGVPGPRPPEKDEGGFALRDFFVFAVPALIAIMLSGTAVWLWVQHSGGDGYRLPSGLSNGLTTILGYYFGIGASAQV